MQLTLSRPDYDTNYRVTKDEPNEAIVTSIVNDLAHNEQYRFGISDISNICTGVNVQHAPVNPRGTRVLIQHREVIDIGTVERPEEAPVTLSLTITVPNSGAITGEVVEAQIVKLMGALYDKADATNMKSQLNALLRGALVPKGL